MPVRQSKVELEQLPRFPLPAGLVEGVSRFKVSGLVRRPLALSLDELRAMPAAELIADFSCEEGWRVPRLRWRGVAVRTVLEAAGVLPEAAYLGVRSGEYLATLALGDLGETEPLLAYELNGEPLPREHGGPLRLVGAATACYESVKWVEQLELLPDPSSGTARSIALARLEAKPS